jgi:hypothetical protein
MELKLSADFLANCEFLPDGTATVNQQEWLKSWAEVAQKQVLLGKIKLHEVKEYDPDTGQVPNAFIKEVYLKNRTVN